MSRRSPIAIYYSEEEKAEIEAEAEQAGKTVSGYCRDLIDQQRQEDAEREVAERMNAEERLEDLLDDGLSDFETLADQLGDEHGLIITILRDIEEKIDAELESGDGDGDDVLEDDLEAEGDEGDLDDRLGDP